jgi:hypothetical protein
LPVVRVSSFCMGALILSLPSPMYMGPSPSCSGSVYMSSFHTLICSSIGFFHMIFYRLSLLLIFRCSLVPLPVFLLVTLAFHIMIYCVLVVPPSLLFVDFTVIFFLEPALEMRFLVVSSVSSAWPRFVPCVSLARYCGCEISDLVFTLFVYPPSFQLTSSFSFPPFLSFFRIGTVIHL